MPYFFKISFKYSIQAIVLLLLSLSLSACLWGRHGYVHNRKQDYLQAQSNPTLQVPRNLAIKKEHPAYPIPTGKGFSQRQAPTLLPPGNHGELTPSAKSSSTAKIEKIILGEGSQGFPRFAITGGYYNVWHKLQTYLTKQGYQIIGSDKKTGVIEVVSPADKDKTSMVYQFVLRQGKTQVFLSLASQTGEPVASATAKTILTAVQKQALS